MLSAALNRRVALMGILLLAMFLHFFRLEQKGYANLYYAAAVKSMLTRWHNFILRTRGTFERRRTSYESQR